MLSEFIAYYADPNNYYLYNEEHNETQRTVTVCLSASLDAFGEETSVDVLLQMDDEQNVHILETTVESSCFTKMELDACVDMLSVITAAVKTFGNAYPVEISALVDHLNTPENWEYQWDEHAGAREQDNTRHIYLNCCDAFLDKLHLEYLEVSIVNGFVESEAQISLGLQAISASHNNYFIPIYEIEAYLLEQVIGQLDFNQILSVIAPHELTNVNIVAPNSIEEHTSH